jgi:uncharacterized damage-inducible protein DinB
MQKIYRKGAVGALMDEYERAAAEYKNLIASLSQEDFTKIIDAHTQDPDCVSAQTISNHVVRAGYGYANYIRRQFNDALVERKEDYQLTDTKKAVKEMDNMLHYTVETLDKKWGMSEEQIMSNIIATRWGQKYDIDQLLEHAIVHILRHRRQIERLMQVQVASSNK